MKRCTFVLLSFILVNITFYNCKNQVETRQYETYKTFYPIILGKYITYRLDSLVTNKLGTTFEIKTYIVKDSVVEQFKDNSNRLSYKIVRYKLDGLNWIPDNSFTVTPLENGLEYIENNLRMVKLVNPVVDGEDWMGNNYISKPPFFKNSDFQFWTYTYTNLNKPFTVNNQTIDSTVTVRSYDSANNKTFYNKVLNNYAKGYEVYAKGIGKIYQDIVNWEYQVDVSYYNCKWIKCVNNVCDTVLVNCNNNSPNCDSLKNTPGNIVICKDTVINSYYYEGYGVKLTLIDHN